MSAAQAAPRPERNAPNPADVVIDQLIARGFSPLLERRADGGFQRPDTGRIIFFPVDRSEGVPPPIPPSVVEHLQIDSTSQLSLTNLRDVLPSELLDALLELPSVSLVEWRALARNRRVGAPRGARPEVS